MLPSPSPALRSARLGFTLMEILVVVSIVLVLATIAVPVYLTVRERGYQAVALSTMRQIVGAAGTYAGQNDGSLPEEDAKGTDGWGPASRPEAAKVWYNALPKILGKKGVGDFANNPRAFYTRENIMFLPGAAYPPDDTKLRNPLFSYAINTKLERKDTSTGKKKDAVKAPAKLGMISNAARTVLFLEQGLPLEKKAMAQQPKYDGSCKGSAKSFVTRYGERGVLAFVDGHVELVDGKNVLTETGHFPFPQTAIIWTRSADEDPNK